MWTRFLIMLALIAFAILSIVGIPTQAKRIQATLLQDSADALEQNGIRIDSLQFNGRDARLSGTVHSNQDKVLAQQITESVRGVRIVENRLRIELSPKPVPPPDPRVSSGALRTRIARQITFQSNSSAFSGEDLALLEDLLGILREYPDVRIEISGHTDNVGGLEANLRLSLERAESVEAFLSDRGIAPSRLIVKGLGATNPLSDNLTEEGRRINRRVEIQLID